MRDLHRSGHDLTCATPPTTKLPGPATTHSGSADWDGASPQEQTLMQRNDSQYHRHRWRHSFHHDFWSALRQPYRYIEAVGWVSVERELFYHEQQPSFYLDVLKRVEYNCNRYCNNSFSNAKFCMYKFILSMMTNTKT